MAAFQVNKDPLFRLINLSITFLGFPQEASLWRWLALSTADWAVCLYFPNLLKFRGVYFWMKWSISPSSAELNQEYHLIVSLSMHCLDDDLNKCLAVQCDVAPLFNTTLQQCSRNSDRFRYILPLHYSRWNLNFDRSVKDSSVTWQQQLM